MKLLFVHGWGFDARIWEGVRHALPDQETCIADLGYFGEPVAPACEGPVLVVGHSLGAMRILLSPPAHCTGLVAINGFDRFSADPSDPSGVPRRVIDRMIARFRQQPEQVLADFRMRCGDESALPEGLRQDALLADLQLLRDGDARTSAARLGLPVLALQGSEDAILPETMRNAVFAEASDIRRDELAGHGHLLPLTAPEWCADHIRAFAADLSRAS